MLINYQAKIALNYKKMLNYTAPIGKWVGGPLSGTGLWPVTRTGWKPVPLVFPISQA
jgi:hypothetical protein